MAFTVAEALQMDTFRKCRLLTGQPGLENEILWVNILEILDDLSHIEPGEFLITTAHDFNARSESRQQKLIELFADRKLAAVAIQTGHYLQEIPASFVRFAEEHRLPLIEIPPEVSFKKLTRALVKRLFYRESPTGEPFSESAPEDALQRDASVMKRLWNMLLAADNPADLHPALEQFGLFTDRPILVMAFHPGKKGEAERRTGPDHKAAFPGQVAPALMATLRRLNLPFLLGVPQEQAAMAVQHVVPEGAGPAADLVAALRIQEEFNRVFPGWKLFIGVSAARSTFGELKQALAEAEKALQAARLGFIDRTGIAVYRSMGLYRLIMNQQNMDTLRDVFTETAAPLLAYDRRRRGALLATLQLYLETGNINRAAESLFIHRHTMRYRLEQIARLTGLNPLLPAEALQLNVGLHIYRYLKAAKLLP